MNRILIALLLLCALPAVAADRITATITITNAPANNDTFTVNSDVRTWKTTVVTPATQIAVTNVVGYATTNLFNQVQGTLYAGPLTVAYAGTNSLSMIAVSGNALVVTASGTWASIVMTTQTVATLVPVRIPISGEVTASQRTNIASGIVAGVESYNTNTFSAGAQALTNHVNRTAAQTISGDKTFTGANVFSNSAQTIVGGYATNLSLINITTASGTLGNLTNGTWTDGTLTNGANYGQPFRSPGTGDGSEQFGTSATASGDGSVAFGPGAGASGLSSSAFGSAANATEDYASAVGANTVAGGENSTTFGALSGATVLNSSAFGASSFAGHTNSTAIGVSATTTVANQIRLGTATEHVSIPGNLRVAGSITNINAVGINTLDGSLAFIRKNITSLANGANSISSSTNLYLKCSGPSGAFSISGIDGGSDGRLLIIQNSTGQVMTLSQESGTEPTAANRLLCSTGADIAISGNPGTAILIYDSALSRWVVVKN